MPHDNIHLPASLRSPDAGENLAHNALEIIRRTREL